MHVIFLYIRAWRHFCVRFLLSIKVYAKATYRYGIGRQNCDLPRAARTAGLLVHRCIKYTLFQSWVLKLLIVHPFSLNYGTLVSHTLILLLGLPVDIVLGVVLIHSCSLVTESCEYYHFIRPIVVLRMEVKYTIFVCAILRWKCVTVAVPDV